MLAMLISRKGHVSGDGVRASRAVNAASCLVVSAGKTKVHRRLRRSSNVACRCWRRSASRSRTRLDSTRAQRARRFHLSFIVTTTCQLDRPHTTRRRRAGRAGRCYVVIGHRRRRRRRGGPGFPSCDDDVWQSVDKEIDKKRQSRAA